MAISERPALAATSFLSQALLLAVLLAACETPAPYAPRDQRQGTGYSDQQLAANRYRITFTGNAATRRETVENYLLLRAAEVTLQAGYPYFLFDTRDTEAKTSYQTSSLDAWPAWRGRGWYHHSWAWEDEVSRPITAYEAYAEIVLLSADAAKNEPRALRAQDVVGHIEPIAHPPQP
ncbi:MAG: hypothetical protein P4L57_08220 [Rhizomicrobium sp.]|nr:hypothetical protein [Rhizomicrobium sp.]